jgi:V/A-type H+-transporting ATPase subunit E
MSKLGEILQQEVLAEIGGILAEADSKAESLVREAKKKASDRMATSEKKAVAKLRAATFLAESTAELNLSTARMQAKSQVIAVVKKKAMDALEQAGCRPDFDRVLEALAEEAMKVIEAPEALVVNPKDEVKLNAWAKRKGLELRTDPGLRLGVRIVAYGGQRSVENSLPERLNRAWERLASGVAQRLWE